MDEILKALQHCKCTECVEFKSQRCTNYGKRMTEAAVVNKCRETSERYNGPCICHIHSGKFENIECVNASFSAFHEPKFATRTLANIIYFAEPYYKIHHPIVSPSWDILNFKNGDDKHLVKFTNEFILGIHKVLNENHVAASDACLFIVPSHKKDSWGDNLTKVAMLVCKKLHIQNFYNGLNRQTDQLEKKLTSREWGSDRNNLFLHKGINVINKVCIVIDDITTSGYSLIDCEYVLKQAGARKIIKFALAHTQKDWEYTPSPIQTNYDVNVEFHLINAST